MIEGVIHHCTEMEVDRQYAALVFSPPSPVGDCTAIDSGVGGLTGVGLVAIHDVN